VRVEEIINHRLLGRYFSALEDLEGKRRQPGCTQIRGLLELKVDSDSFAAGATDLNEYFAFHGAPADVVDQICRAGFDPQRGGDNAGCMFGVAAYFAANASKSDIYTGVFPPSTRRTAERQLIIARVAMGASYETRRPLPDSHRAPDGYDSVWTPGRPDGGCVDHQEIMIYKEQQALPLLVVTYVHACQDLCAECQKRRP